MFLLVLLGGCFSPTFEEGLPCAEGECPGDLVCNAFEKCVAPQGDEDKDASVSGYDGGPGSIPDAEPGDECQSPIAFAVSNFDRCTLPVAGPPLNWGGGPITIDTGAATVDLGAGPVTFGAVSTQLSGESALLAVVEDFTIAEGTVVTTTGPNPLVVISTGDVTVLGTLSVAAAGTTPGAGGNSAACGVGVGPDGIPALYAGSAGGAGGGGGGYGSGGATGGFVDQSDNQVATAGGQPNGDASLVPLRGGCPGGKGGEGVGEASAAAGLGGGGGGAIQLVAAGQVLIGPAGTIAAGGGGGGASDFNIVTNVQATPLGGGGGGGGSGGAILLEGNAIDNSGNITANGGGGGEGTIANSIASYPGSDAPTTGLVGGAGGQANAGNAGTPDWGNGWGGDGGTGGGGETQAAGGGTGQSTVSNLVYPDGGGGGGGSIGRIRFRAVNGVTDNGVVSPPYL
jgi:hypothetical protein